jgi:hypothetical protein
MEQGDDVEALFLRILACLATLTNYLSVALQVHSAKNYITCGDSAKTDFLKVTYFVGSNVSCGYQARAITALMYNKPWSGSLDVSHGFTPTIAEREHYEGLTESGSLYQAIVSNIMTLIRRGCGHPKFGALALILVARSFSR